MRAILDAVERFQRTRADGQGMSPMRSLIRIEHAEIIDPKDVPRLKSLGVVVSMMPAHALPGEEASNEKGSSTCFADISLAEGIWSRPSTTSIGFFHTARFNSVSRFSSVRGSPAISAPNDMEP